MNQSNEFIDKNYKYAVIGASTNPEKYGHKVFLDLSGADYNVYGVNINGGEINGIQLFTNLSELYKSNTKVDVAIFVIPPEVGLKVLNDVVGLNIRKVWFQPGAESSDLIEMCQKNDISCMHDACIMVERRKENLD